MTLQYILLILSQLGNPKIMQDEFNTYWSGGGKGSTEKQRVVH